MLGIILPRAGVLWDEYSTNRPQLLLGSILMALRA